LKWIAIRLQMGTGASLSNLLSARRRGQGKCQYVGLTPFMALRKTKFSSGFQSAPQSGVAAVALPPHSKNVAG